MSLISSESEVVTKENLAEFYQAIYPYLGGYDKGKLTYVGEIRMFYSETAPDGFLICDGSEYNKADYPELVNKLFSLTDTTPYVVDGDDTKFKVPDLRGEFLRGSGTNSHENQGSGDAVGVHQDGTEHVVIQPGPSCAWIGGASASTEPFTIDADSYPSKTSELVKARAAQGSASGGTYDSRFTSRPTNTSVLFCIAYKTIVVDIDFLSYGSEKFAKSNMYDTNERVIGKWIDGKPLYQKTVTNLSITVTTSWVSLLSIQDCEVILGVNIVGKYSNNIYTGFIDSRLSGTQVQVKSTDALSSVVVNTVTLQYTKTTDSADSFKYSTPTDYSTEEKIIGTWIDGKPLYQRTYQLFSTEGSANSYVTVVKSSTDPNIQYIDDIITATISGKPMQANPARCKIASGNIQVMFNGGTGLAATNYLTIQYTKTTD